MKILLLALLLCVTQNVLCQGYKFYIEKDNALALISESEFDSSIDHSKNVEVYVENENGKMGIIFTRKRDGKLNADEMKTLKSFFKEKSDVEILSEDYIVVDYISAAPLSDSITMFTQPKSYQKKYLKKLNKIASTKTFIVYNLNGRTQWMSNEQKSSYIPDREDTILKLLFPAQPNYGNAAVIRPDGTFQAYLGEYSPNEVFRMIEELKKMP